MTIIKPNIVINYKQKGEQSYENKKTGYNCTFNCNNAFSSCPFSFRVATKVILSPCLACSFSALNALKEWNSHFAKIVE